MARTRTSLRPALEVLECRDTPAGTVLATFAGGTLTLTGDSSANSLYITQYSDDRLVISGVLTGVRLNGGPMTGGLVLPAPVTGSIAVKLGGGADTLTVAKVDLPGSLTINGGDGGNVVTFENGVTVHGNLTVTNGPDIDKTTLSGPLNVTGGLAIANGPGGFNVFGDATTDLQIGGTFAISGGAGPGNTIGLGAATRVAAGRIALNLGSQFNITDLTPVGPLTVAAGIRVTGGPGLDVVALGGATLSVGGGITVNAGGGDNDIKVQPAGSLSVGGTVSVTGGAGHDAVRVGGGGSATAIGGGVVVSVGDGGSLAHLEGSELTVGGSIRMSAAAGVDETNILAMDGGTIAGNVTVNQGASNEQDVFVGTDTPARTLAIGGALNIASGDTVSAHDGNTVNLLSVSVGLGTTIATGSGHDLVKVNDSVFGGPFIVSTGDRGDQVLIEQQGTSGTTRFRGMVRVNTGGGTDVVGVGTVNIPDRAAFSGSSVWNGGAGTGDSIAIESWNTFYGTQPTTVGFETVL